MLKIYNTLTRQKELFNPIQPKKIGIYVCGLTVYDECHIGHARLFVCYDMIVRYLRSIGYEVTYVRNITDIDDKIIKRANESKIDYQELTKKIIASALKDEKALNVLPPDFTPYVTEHIPQIIEMIQTLIDKNYAYRADNGDVYFDVTKFTSYGELAHQDLESLQTNVHLENTELKKHPLDFALWKTAKPNEPFWQAPWGNGRPGWHIECSAMAKKYLGENFDIHGGGSDLQFPHHQNELAQSEAANGCQFVNYWMHMGFVQVDAAKMSKSLGNFFTIKHVLEHYNPEVLRYFLIASHYRSPVNYSRENLDNAQTALERLYIALRDVKTDGKIDDKFVKRFREAMNDDFNTPEALAVLFDLAHQINKSHDVNLATTLKYLGSVLGILWQKPEEFLHSGVDETKIAELIAARNLARKNKNWAESDRIRDELAQIGVTLEDTAQGTVWKKGR